SGPGAQPRDLLRIEAVVVPQDGDRQESETEEPLDRIGDREQVPGGGRRNQDDREERSPDDRADERAPRIVPASFEELRDDEERDEDGHDGRGDDDRFAPDVHGGPGSSSRPRRITLSKGA